MEAINVKNLSFSYGRDFALNEISFSIKKGSVSALIGNNGSGKTTLLRLIVGLLKPTSGTVKIFDKELTRKKEDLWKIRQNIGFLFQNPDDQLFAPTIEEDVGFGARNLKLPEEEVNERVEWALKSVDLFEYKNYSPFDLSWGQKKRASLAGLLVLKPKLLILDEPFANLDFNAIYKNLEIFESLRNKLEMTILFTTHNFFFVENWAEKMLVLNNGKKIYEGTPLEGFEQSKVKDLVGSFDLIKKLINSNKYKNEISTSINNGNLKD